MEAMFEKASRLKLRFESPKGLLTAEDLWDLPLTSKNSASLDGIAIALSKKLKDQHTESFVPTSAKKSDESLEVAFGIVKHVITVRVKENEEAQNAKNKAEEKRKILDLIARKKDEKLEGATVEELEKRLAEL